MRIKVTDYGVVADGKTDDTAALQAAIFACGKHDWLKYPRGRRLLIKGVLRVDQGGVNIENCDFAGGDFTCQTN